jgi:large subunit ribosomal protein L2
MPVRKIKPTTPGQRHKLVISFDAHTKNEPTKSLLKPNKKSGGRNSRGKMTIQYIVFDHQYIELSFFL